MLGHSTSFSDLLSSDFLKRQLRSMANAFSKFSSRHFLLATQVTRSSRKRRYPAIGVARLRPELRWQLPLGHADRQGRFVILSRSWGLLRQAGAARPLDEFREHLRAALHEWPPKVANPTDAVPWMDCQQPP